jgi:hypothetical protein
MPRLVTVAVLLFLTVPARAGLYFGGESVADLPSQWRGFLPDQRALRLLAARPGPGVPAQPLRDAYREAADALVKLAGQRPLTADEAADLGALHLRLGATDAALNVLRAAHRQHPDHFRLTANLGTAWQVQGDLDQAIQALREAVRLAPPAQRRAEELHLKLVTLRRGQPRGTQSLDDLFGVRYVGDKGDYVPDTMAADERAKLPADTVALLQQLSLWLPADGRLLWQVGELANAFGDVRTAAAILDSCVSELGMGDVELRRHRSVLRAAADQLAKQPPADNARPSELTFRSPRPLASRLDAAKVSVRADGLTTVTWGMLNATTLDAKFRPTFSKTLQQLDGKKVALTGYMVPFDDAQDLPAFLVIEDQFCCLSCELPAMAGRVYIELPEGQTTPLTRNPVTITGKLILNSTDPDACFYSIVDAIVEE